MKIYTSEVEMLRAQCRQWEKVCDSHLRLIKKLKKERQWVGLTSVDWNDFNAVKASDPQYVAQWAEAKLKEKNT